MAMATYQVGEHFTFVDSAGAATITVTLPNPGASWIIDSIWVFAVGTITAFNVQVQKADGVTLIAGAGGQVNAAALPFHVPLVGPIACAPADGPRVVLVATGSTSVTLTVNAHKGN